MTNEMGSQHQLVRIVEILPYHLRSRWLRCVKDIRHQGRSPGIEDVKFVAGAAEEVNDPVYGGLFEDRKRETQRPKSPASQSANIRSFSSHGVSFARSDNHVRRCVLCSQNHELFGCKDFKDMSQYNDLTWSRRSVCALIV